MVTQKYLNAGLKQTNIDSNKRTEPFTIFQKQVAQGKIKEDDAVIIHDDKKSRALWSITKTKSVLLSKDKKVIGATIKSFINGNTVVINRPINKLYRIDQ